MRVIVPAAVVAVVFMIVGLRLLCLLMMIVPAAIVTVVFVIVGLRLLSGLLMIVAATVVTFVFVIVLMAHGLEGLGSSRTVPIAKLAA